MHVCKRYKMFSAFILVVLFISIYAIMGVAVSYMHIFVCMYVCMHVCKRYKMFSAFILVVLFISIYVIIP
jgi:hypothetical protein